MLPENVYNMDETGVMLSMLGSVKVLVVKDDLRGHRGVGVKTQADYGYRYRVHQC
jgi:hypothetical protein